MSAIAAYACISTWQADLRADLPKIDIPVMVIQGDADRILPFDQTGKRLSGMIARYWVTHALGGPAVAHRTHDRTFLQRGDHRERGGGAGIAVTGEAASASHPG